MGYLATYLDTGSSTTASATAPATDYPPGLVAGARIWIVVLLKYPGATITSVPAGFVLLTSATGGSGAAGDDSGNVDLYIYQKISDGTETGAITVNISGANIAVIRTYAFYDLNFPRVSFDIKIVSKAFATPNQTAISVTMTDDMDLRPDDLLFMVFGMNTDAATMSAYTFTQTGATFGVRSQKGSVGTSGGNDLRFNIVTCNVATGTVNGPTTYSQTGSVGVANGPCGPVIIIRIRARRRRRS